MKTHPYVSPLLLASWPILGSCNPDLVNMVSGGSSVPLAPGPVEMVQVFLFNQTQYSQVTFLVRTEDPDLGGFSFDTNPRIGRIGAVIKCPTGRIGLGDLDDPTALNAALVFNPLDPLATTGQPVPVAFGLQPLVEGISYQCGDTIFIVASDDSRFPSGIAFSMSVVSGAQQTPVADVETFQVIKNVLIREGLF